MIFIPIQYQELDNEGFNSIDPEAHSIIQHAQDTPNSKDMILVLQDLIHDESIETEKKTFILNNLAATYFDQGDYTIALAANRESLNILQHSPSIDEVRLAKSMHNVGLSLFARGQYIEALHTLLQSQKLLESSPNDTTILHSHILDTCGFVYDAMGEPTQSFDSHQKSLEMRKMRLGPICMEVAASQNNIGLVFDTQGKFDVSQEHLMIAKDILEKLKLEDSLIYAIILNNLGCCHHNQGNYREGCILHQQALEVAKKASKNDLIAGICMNNIGFYKKNQSDYYDALEQIEQAERIFLAHYGQTHPETAKIYNNIGIVSVYQWDFKKALEEFTLCLDIRKKHLGERHLLVAQSYNNIGLVYQRRAEYQKSIDYYKKALEIYLSIFGEQHPHVGILFNNIGYSSFLLGNNHVALKNYCLSIKLKKQVLRNYDMNMAITCNHMGNLFSEIEDLDEAISQHKQSLLIYFKLFGAEHQKIWSLKDKIVTWEKRMDLNSPEIDLNTL
jgi:tetratricopeptide (TPR) repeat protein